jgi:1-acyl-sn-glycerol-3-phosphate acyltransferase
MSVLRSALFNVAFFVNTFVWAVVFCLPTFVLPRRAIIGMAQAWARSNLVLMRWIVGTHVEFRGLERVRSGALMVAAKHQSAWETFALLTVLEDPVFILKRELTWIPFFGWLLIKAGMIPIDRKAGRPALAAMGERAAAEVARGRQLIIFPEGTRRAIGAPPDYKYGVSHLYRQLGVPCLPVALNAGLFWPRRSFMRRAGTIVVEFLEPIAAGRDRDEFLTELERQIETASNRLLQRELAVPAVADPK